MSDENPTLNDICRLLGSMNERFGERFEALDRQAVGTRQQLAALDARPTTEVAKLRGEMQAGFGAPKASI